MNKDVADIYREESAIGDWVITVVDQNNPEQTGKFVAWSLQLWGESINPELARDWSPAEDGQPDEEQVGSEATPTSGSVSQKPKPTDHLPDDHGEAPGESHKPGLGGGDGSGIGDVEGGEGDDAPETVGGGDADNESALDEGWFSGVSNLGGNTSWVAGAGGIVLVAGASIGGFFILRQRKKRGKMFGLGLANSGEGARGAYAPVSDDVPMGLLARGRRKFGGNTAGGGSGTKDLYDAFGDGPSDEDDDNDDDEGGGGVGLRYHDSFLDDEDAVSPGPRGRGRGSAEGSGSGSGPPEYDEPRREHGGDRASGSSGSWQDAAEVEEAAAGR